MWISTTYQRRHPKKLYSNKDKHGDDIDPDEVKEDKYNEGVAQETDEVKTVTKNVHLAIFAKNLRMPTSLLKV